MQSKTIIDLLRNESSKLFIAQHLNDSIYDLAINANKNKNYDIKTIAALIQIYKKAETKLPEHFKMLAAFNDKSYEQSTSEAVALCKAEIMNLKGKSVINLCAGIGIDDWAMSKKAVKIDSCEIDSDIHQMAEFNIQLFSLTNITRHHVDGISFIKTALPADCIYIDPDRRPNASRVFLLEDCEPNLLNNMPLLLDKCNELWIKLSPMADISYILNKIENINEVYVIANQGEVKEILIALKKNHLEKLLISAINLTNSKTEIFNNKVSFNPPVFFNEGNFLYEPNKAIIKSGLSMSYAASIHLKMLCSNSHFYISDDLIFNFYGRVFKIINRLIYKPKLIKSYLKQSKILKANITCRNFREKPEEIKKRYSLSDGGVEYLCFTTDNNGQMWMFHCSKVNS